jgi:hypothetical protein
MLLIAELGVGVILPPEADDGLFVASGFKIRFSIFSMESLPYE